MTTASRTQDHFPSARSLVIGMLAGPVVWIVYFMIGYGLIEAACKTPLFGFSLAGLMGISIIVIGLTLVALVVVVWAGGMAYRNWQQLGDVVEPGTEDEASLSAEWLSVGHGRFMAFTGLLLNGLFAIIIFATGLPALLLWPC